MSFPRLKFLCLQLWLSTNALAIDRPFEAEVLDVTELHRGPGEAIATTILSGSGPCHIQLDNSSTIFNPSSWTNHFNVLYIDEVAGSGFSKIADVKTDIPSTMREVAEDIKLFMKTFTGCVFPELKGREFHLMGESFGGFLVPYVATSILDEQRSQNRPEIDLRTIILTSPLIDFGYSAASYYDVLCTGEVLYLNATECTTIGAAVPRCEADARRCRYDGNDAACNNVGESCGIILSYWYPPERNIVNLKKPCYSFPTCSFWAEHVEIYMNNLKTQKRLGLKGPLPLEFRHMDMEINQAFGDAMLRPNWTQFTHLLEDTNLRILIRTGELDADTPRIGNERAADSFAWYGQAAFRASPHRPWYHVPRGSGHSVRGGFFKGYDKLWLASADNAGHILDADDPEAGLYILKSWILGDFYL
ncbi:hypothetical protein E8E14_006085 [Neopestalotiopsis sp. 37M]|nr:hypothetical protein E8E14_006085 [Neopestalotiopsis sp. 37M]